MNVYFQRENYFLIKHNYKVTGSYCQVTQTSTNLSHNCPTIPGITGRESKCHDHLNSQMHISPKCRMRDDTLYSVKPCILHALDPPSSSSQSTLAYL